MTKTAFLFPGQGSQAVGMGQVLAASSPAARAVLDQVDQALGQPLAALMAEGPDEQLRLTRNAQPALMAVSMAVVRALEDAAGKPLQDMADCVAGHSLGEYSALAAVGAMELETAARLLRLRGEAMQEAVPVGAGAMAALLGASLEQAEEIIAAHGKSILDIANDNAPGQIVISGDAAAVEAALVTAREAGIRRAVKLPVSAPFHCRLMAPAADAMATALAAVTLQPPVLPVFCNVTAAAETEPMRLREHLVSQVTARVRWRESLLAMAESGITRFVELGSGKVLSGLVKRTLPEAEIFSVETPDDLEDLLGVI